LPGDTRTLGLLGELGLGDAVAWERTRTGLYDGTRMYPLDGVMDYLRLPTLGPVAKGRLAFTLMMAARIRDGRPLEQIPVGDWLTRWSGRAAFERLWQPLLRAKLGDNSKLASAAFIWATIRRLYLARSAGAKTERLGYIDGGYARVLAALRARLEAAKVEVLTGCPVLGVAQHADRLRVDTGRGPRVFDRVVSTLPCGPTARLCPELSPDIQSRLDGVVYQGIICASVVLDRPLAGRYLSYLTDPVLPFTAVVEMSALTGTERFDGRTLVYLPRYVTQSDPYWDLSDDEVERRFLAGLRRIFPDLTPGSLLATRLARVRNVMAVPTVGYPDVVPPVTTNVEGLFVVNSAQIADGTLNVDATLGVVERALPLLISEVPARPARVAA
jgi:protoporphyrinogen oxidase